MKKILVTFLGALGFLAAHVSAQDAPATAENGGENAAGPRTAAKTFASESGETAGVFIAESGELAPAEVKRVPPPPEGAPIPVRTLPARLPEDFPQAVPAPEKPASAESAVLNPPEEREAPAPEKTGAAAAENAFDLAAEAADKNAGGDISKVLDSEDLIDKLLEKSPFGIPPKGSISEVAGVSLKSIAFVDGKWRFSVVNKDQKSAWIALNEDCQIFPCKIISYEEDSMSVKALIGGKTFDLSMADRASFSNQKIELAAGILPPDRVVDRRKAWEYATDAQKAEVNRIAETARAQGRRMNPQEYRRIMEIERGIQLPEGAGVAGGGNQGGQNNNRRGGNQQRPSR